MRRSTRTSVGAISVLAAALAVSLLPGAGRAQTPLYFPRTQTLDTTAYTLRIAGSDRYATAGALTRVAAHHQRTDTGFPFNEPDATAITKSYGFGTCPRSVGIAAGDSVADALAAASVKDIGLLTTDTGDQVDTTGIELLLAVSARQGGFQADLPTETLNNLSDLRDACGTFDILVFGGETAVPAPAFEALKALGETTTRIVGIDRFDTARKVALAVHGVKGPTAVQLFVDATAPTNLPSAVFLAEGFTGADALAAGPYLANKNVPILLTETGKLPEATRNALLTLRPQNVIVLGGPGAVSDDTAKAAKRAAGIAPPPEGEEEVITRIAGEDRYQTSIAIAQQLFNVQPCCSTGSPTEMVPGLEPETVSFSNQFMSFARSEGSGAAHAGFADALSSAFFLDTASDVAVAPIRRAPPIESNTAPQNEDGTFGQKPMIGGTAGPRRAPLLLVPQGAVPEATATYLGEVFSEPGKTSTTPDATEHGGFGFVFGGEAAAARPTELALAQLLSGGTYTVAEDGPGARTDLVPSMAPTQIFYTAMSYDGYTTPAGNGMSARGTFAEGDKICAARGALKGAQWLAAYEAGAFGGAGDVDYQDGASSRWFCMDAVELGSGRAQVLAFSLSGHETAPVSLDWSGDRLSIDPPASDDRADTVTDGGNLMNPQTCDEPITGLTCSGAGKSSATFSGITNVDYKGTAYTDAPWTLTLNFNRDPDTDVITYTGTLTVRDGTSLLFTASVTGESSTQASPFKLSGMYSTGQGKGGMRATVTTPAEDNFVLTDLVLEGTA